MPGSIIAGGARTPIGKLSGALKGFQAVDLGGLAIKAALEKAGVGGEQVDYVIMGHVLQARRWADHRPPGRGPRRHPDDRARGHGEQGLPVRPGRDCAGRPADRVRRVRRGGGRRNGVDDQRAALALRGPGPGTG